MKTGPFRKEWARLPSAILMHDMRSWFSPRASFIGILFLSLCATALLPQATFAQTTDDAARAKLQAQLNSLEKEIADNQAIVNSLAAQGKSLSTEVQTLNAQIKKAQLQVQATQVAIKHLDANISIHQKTISTLADKLDSEKSALAQILRQTDQLDQLSIVEVAFSTENLSTLLGDLDSYTFVKQALGKSYTVITGNKLQTEAEKSELEAQLNQQQQVAQLQLAAKQQVQTQQAQKQQLLTQTKGQESQYKEIVAAKQKTAAQIRLELFGLAGGSGKIPLPTAIAYAKTASGITGVRAAFILAILSQESDLGVNVGQCYVTNLTTGDGKGKNTGKLFPELMAVLPKRDDTGVFKRIMDALGRDWSTTPVSCYISATTYGGAMGPTQFLPTTWANQVEGPLKRALGIAATDPWNPLHAIVATGIYLSNVGGTGGTYAAEHTAAAKYYAGGGWATAGQVYANSVMDKAAQFQNDIDTLAGS